MPTYEYECKSCGYNVEVFQAMSDEPLKTCAKCGKEVRRLIFGGAGIIFKGSGFYVTDKGKGATASAGKTAKPESKTADGKAAASSTPASDGAASSSVPAKDSAVRSSKPAPSGSDGV